MSKVAIIPLQAFLDAKGDSELVASLAKSVERNAVVKYLRRMAEQSGCPALVNGLASYIEQGKHV